ncbi:hypothetical protein V2J09_000356 [Rumex salicifolius]
MADAQQEDLDLLLSLQDRVLETPPSSPSSSRPHATGYLSDDEPPKRNRDADMSVFKDAVQECMDYDTEAAKKAFKSNSFNKSSNEPGVEKFSGLRIRKQLVSAMELNNRFADIRFIRLSAIKNLIVGDSVMGCWATIGVLTEKGSPKTSSIGQSYCLWKIGCLDEQTISIFLFGKAYQMHSKESAGTVFAVFNAGVRKDTSASGICLSVSNADQMLKIGTSVDYGVCNGKRKDGMACTMVVNKRKGIYCSYHRSKTSEKYTNTRIELQGGNLRTAFRDPLKREGIFLVDPLADKSAKSKKPTKVLSVEGLRKALSNSSNVTTNIHSQGVRFLTQVTANLDKEKKNGPTLQTNTTMKRSSNTDSSAIKRNQVDNKRVKTSKGKFSASEKTKPNIKMVELEIISSDEES